MEVTADAWAVDAGCSGNPGPMEYQCIDLATGERVFHFGPMKGTNNIGEFLAIVHALAMLYNRGDSTTAIYSDSRTAQIWVRKRKCGTKLERTEKNARLLDIVLRAEQWLQTHTTQNPIYKWQTDKWGEIPADFGRK
jgi:ribonuclease HI